jgi:hypothetical protein
MNREIKKAFFEVVVNSLTSQQVNFLGEQIDKRFSLKSVSGFGESMPVPRKTAAQVLVDHFTDENDIIAMFTFMIVNEGQRFYNRELVIWGKEDFIALTRKHKWIYDPGLVHFLRDPFYEREINLLKKIRIIDLRQDFPYDEIIAEIARSSRRMGIRDLEWRIAIRLYDIEKKSGELIKNIIEMLLVRQSLQQFHGEIFICLRELATNASKAGYKKLFEKYHTVPAGITAESNYPEFLRRFKDEVSENGNDRLLDLARRDDLYYTITFQSTMDSIEVWVTNNQCITLLEKRQLLKKMGMQHSWESGFDGDVDDLAEGAGLGIMLIQRVLGSLSTRKRSLSVVFYPDMMKIGFQLDRANLQRLVNAAPSAK